MKRLCSLESTVASAAVSRAGRVSTRAESVSTADRKEAADSVVVSDASAPLSCRMAGSVAVGKGSRGVLPSAPDSAVGSTSRGLVGLRWVDPFVAAIVSIAGFLDGVCAVGGVGPRIHTVVQPENRPRHTVWQDGQKQRSEAGTIVWSHPGKI